MTSAAAKANHCNSGGFLPLLALLLQASLILLLLLVAAADAETVSGDAGRQSQDQDTSSSSSSAGSTMNLDPEAVKEALADLLRSESGFAPGEGGAAEDGFSEAAQEYLQHVQSILADATSPSELYIREQLADLETLHSLLAGLQHQLQSTHLARKTVSRLTHRLVKGPARDLLLPLLLWQPQQPNDNNSKASVEDETMINYVDSQLAKQIIEAATQLSKFLVQLQAEARESSANQKEAGPDGDATTLNVADRLRNFATDATDVSQAGQDYLMGVLDRMLELEGRQVKFNVEYPDNTVEAQIDGDNSAVDEESLRLGKPKVTQIKDDDKDLHPDETLQQGSSSSASAADEGGRQLFDQVLSRRAAAKVAAALREDRQPEVDGAGRPLVRAVIEELRGRRYKPSGVEAMLEAIEECLANNSKQP